jgi:hypothetical protein
LLATITAGSVVVDGWAGRSLWGESDASGDGVRSEDDSERAVATAGAFAVAESGGEETAVEGARDASGADAEPEGVDAVREDF